MKKGMIITAAAILVMGFGMSEVVIAENTTKAVIIAQDDVKYDEVSTDELPEEVSTSIQEGYGDYTVSKAFKGDDGTFKAKLEKDDEKISVFFNEAGEFLKIEQAEGSWDTGTEPVEEAPVEEAPVEEAPIEEAPVEEAPVDPMTP
jgi:hypothetical protein